MNNPPALGLALLKRRWKEANAPHLVALVKASVAFNDGEAEMFHADPEPEVIPG